MEEGGKLEGVAEKCFFSGAGGMPGLKVLLKDFLSIPSETDADGGGVFLYENIGF
ncbi:TPA: hypothetical protein WMV14_000578 [Neisseria gonorrhoeae]